MGENNKGGRKPGLEIVKVQQLSRTKYIVVLRDKWWENNVRNIKKAARQNADYHINHEPGCTSHAEYVKMVTLDGDDYHIVKVSKALEV